jgi:DNA-binding transcriptional MerR regulator
MRDLPRSESEMSALDDGAYPGYSMGAAAGAIRVTPAFLRSAEAAGLFHAHRSTGGHRRYSRDDLHRAERARHLLDDGIGMDAAVRIVTLEYELAAAQRTIAVLRQRQEPPKRSSRG